MIGTLRDEPRSSCQPSCSKESSQDIAPEIGRHAFTRETPADRARYQNITALTGGGRRIVSRTGERGRRICAEGTRATRARPTPPGSR